MATPKPDCANTRAASTEVQKCRSAGSRPSASRSFYVGDHVQQENIKAKFQDGTLYLLIPKLVPQPQLEQKNLIAIEG